MNKLIAPLLLTLVLTACGGGGGGSSSSPASGGKITVTSIATHTNRVYTEAVADLNGDGLEDVVISGWNYDNATAYVYILMQNADGTLTDRTSLLPSNVVAGSQRILLADFDNDGRMDIFIPGFGDGSVLTHQNSVMFWGTSGAYIRNDWTDNSMAHGACIGDLNNDGKMDMILAGSGAWINNGSRGFTLNNLFANNYFSACAVINEGTTNTIYLANNSMVNGFRDTIAVYDFGLNLISATGNQSDNNYDTVDVVVSDLTGDGHKDFVLALNAISVPSAGPREILAYTGPNTYTYSSTLETVSNQYYARALSIGGVDSVFFSGDALTASVYKGTAKYKSSAFASMGGSSWEPANVYQNTSNGKVYMLELINNTFYTQEMQ
jgi:hypothetical protein